MADLAEDFDQVALVVDWLDACRNRDLAALLALYADDATFECGCGEVGLHEGRAELEAYWRPRLDALAPTAFGLEEITPTADGVVLESYPRADAYVALFPSLYKVVLPTGVADLARNIPPRAYFQPSQPSGQLRQPP